MTVDGKSFRDRLATKFPQCCPQLLEFQSAGFMIDVNILGETYVIDSVTTESVGINGFGLSRQKDAVYGWEGVDQIFETPEALESEIEKLLGLGN